MLQYILLYYVGSALRLQAKTKAIENSLEIADSLLSFEFTKIRVGFEKSFDSGSISPADLYDHVTSSDNTHATVRYLLNKLETAAIAVQMGVADEETLYTSLGFILQFWFKRYQPFIEEFRIRHGDPTTYVCGERLAKSWQAGKYFSTGKNLPEDV